MEKIDIEVIPNRHSERIIMSNKTIVIIPARGGSKGIPRKNILEIAGRPLIAWSILQAKNAKLVDEVFVSTEDKEIAAVSKEYGAKVIDRPLSLSGGDISSEDVLLHALKQIETKLVVFLQATSPIREAEDIDKAIYALTSENLDSIFSCNYVHGFTWSIDNHSKMQPLDYNPKTRPMRQERSVFTMEENGSIYVFKSEILKTYNCRLGGKIGIYVMPTWKSYQLDGIEDIEICEYYLKKLSI